jgi:hypothetical protein
MSAIFLLIFCASLRQVLFRDSGNRFAITPPKTSYLNIVSDTILSLSEDEIPVKQMSVGIQNLER